MFEKEINLVKVTGLVIIFNIFKDIVKNNETCKRNLR